MAKTFKLDDVVEKEQDGNKVPALSIDGVIMTAQECAVQAFSPETMSNPARQEVLANAMSVLGRAMARQAKLDAKQKEKEEIEKELLAKKAEVLDPLQSAINAAVPQTVLDSISEYSVSLKTGKVSISFQLEEDEGTISEWADKLGKTSLSYEKNEDGGFSPSVSTGGTRGKQTPGMDEGLWSIKEDERKDGVDGTFAVVNSESKSYLFIPEGDEWKETSGTDLLKQLASKDYGARPFASEILNKIAEVTDSEFRVPNVEK